MYHKNEDSKYTKLNVPESINKLYGFLTSNENLCKIYKGIIDNSNSSKVCYNQNELKICSDIKIDDQKIDKQLFFAFMPKADDSLSNFSHTLSTYQNDMKLYYMYKFLKDMFYALKFLNEKPNNNDIINKPNFQIVHNDIKPDNIVFKLGENNDVLFQLIDFDASSKLSLSRMKGTQKYFNLFIHYRYITDYTFDWFCVVLTILECFKFIEIIEEVDEQDETNKKQQYNTIKINSSGVNLSVLHFDKNIIKQMILSMNDNIDCIIVNNITDLLTSACRMCIRVYIKCEKIETEMKERNETINEEIRLNNIVKTNNEQLDAFYKKYEQIFKYDDVKTFTKELNKQSAEAKKREDEVKMHEGVKMQDEIKMQAEKKEIFFPKLCGCDAYAIKIKIITYCFIIYDAYLNHKRHVHYIRY